MAYQWLLFSRKILQVNIPILGNKYYMLLMRQERYFDLERTSYDLSSI